MTTNQKAATVAPVKQEEYKTIGTINCRSCGSDVEIQENINHHEYIPSGKCEKCGLLHLMVNREEAITIGIAA